VPEKRYLPAKPATSGAVGNRLSQESTVNGLPFTLSYAYDDANRIASVDEVEYSFDANPLAHCGDYAATCSTTA